MTYNTYEDFDELPERGPGLLKHNPFPGFGKCVYFIPMLNRKVLCYRAVNQHGREVLVHVHAPYQDLMQRVLEEALAIPSPNQTWATSEEIMASFEASEPKGPESEC